MANRREANDFVLARMRVREFLANPDDGSLSQMMTALRPLSFESKMTACFEALGLQDETDNESP